MIWVKRFLMTVGLLACIASVLVVSRMDFSKAEPRVLSEHPNAKWRGGADGGQYIEVTRSEPPYYFVQVRNDDGSLWDEGWLKFGEKNGEPLTANDVVVFTGEGVIYLQQCKVLSADRAKAEQTRC